MTKTDLEQYQKQADIIKTAATAKITQARTDIARWISPDNKNCKPYRLHFIGSKMQDAWYEYDKLAKACEKLNHAKPNEAPALYSTITTSYEEIDRHAHSITFLMK